MLPLSDGLPARRFPVVNVLLIVANFAVFILYELPNLNSAVYHASFYPCTVDSACRGPEPWGESWITAMFLHGGWDLYGSDFEIEYPTGSGKRLTLDLIAADLQDRLISLFTTDANGRRPCFGGTERMQTDPAWHDNLIFGEYFHGDNGAALGACHQTGWTGLIGDVILRRHGAAPSIAEVLSDLSKKAGQ